MTSILNIAGYLFTPLEELHAQKAYFLPIVTDLKGTILLSPEGINLSLAGETSKVRHFQAQLKNHPLLQKLTFRESYSKFIPFKRLKIKIKKETITFRKNGIQPHEQRGPSISPAKLKEWLDTNQPVTLLDTRNDYEVNMGTFKKAIHLNLADFNHFSHEKLPTLKQPIVMFCTGGIRCEKASLYLLQSGFAEVYQLEGGILNYFKEVGGAHFEGHCFVFDDRIAVNQYLEPVDTN